MLLKTNTIGDEMKLYGFKVIHRVDMNNREYEIVCSIGTFRDDKMSLIVQEGDFDMAYPLCGFWIKLHSQNYAYCK